MANLSKYPELLKILKYEQKGLPPLKPVEVDGRFYDPRAFVFLMLGLRKALEICDKTASELTEEQRHVTGRELLEGIRQRAVELFGPLTESVFRHWGIHRTEDWGEIVFLLVESGVLRKTERDTRKDFVGGYDFSVAFRPPDYWRNVVLDTLSLPEWGADAPVRKKPRGSD